MLGSFWRGEASLRQLRALIAALPHDSAVHRLRNGGRAWTWTDHMLWYQCKLLDRLTLAVAASGGVRGVKPLGLPDYPWEESKAAVVKYGDRGDSGPEEVIDLLDAEFL